MEKTFALDSSAIKPLATGRGSCFATDRITVDGAPVGYMYREVPDGAGDSGWRFFEGSELPDYLADAENFEIYDVNTIVNYDPAILPFLDAEVGTALTRTADGFAPAMPPDEDD